MTTQLEAIADLINAATIARNEANIRGDYNATYVSKLTAAIDACREYGRLNLAAFARVDGSNRHD